MGLGREGGGFGRKGSWYPLTFDPGTVKRGRIASHLRVEVQIHGRKNSHQLAPTSDSWAYLNVWHTVEGLDHRETLCLTKTVGSNICHLLLTHTSSQGDLLPEEQGSLSLIAPMGALVDISRALGLWRILEWKQFLPAF